MPLPVSLNTGYISSCDLTREEETDLHDNARSCVPLLNSAATKSSQSWTLLREKTGVTLWEDYQKNATSYSVKSETKIMASVEEIMQVLDCPSSTTYRSFMRVTYRNDFADAAVLYHNSLNSHETLALRWCAFRCPNPLVFDQDFCLVEYAANDSSCFGSPPVNNQEEIDSDQLDNNTTSPVAVRFMQSVRIKQCPSLEGSHKFERGEIPYCGFLFWPTRQDGITKVVFIANITQPSVAPRRRANRYLLQTLAHSIGRLQNAVEAYRMGTKLASRSLTWIRDSDRPECYICFRRFSHLRRRHHCRICGEVICKNCSVHKDVDLPSVGLTTLRMCRKCEDIGISNEIPVHQVLSAQNTQRNTIDTQLTEEIFVPSIPQIQSQSETGLMIKPPGIIHRRKSKVPTKNEEITNMTSTIPRVIHPISIPSTTGLEHLPLSQRIQKAFKFHLSHNHSPTIGHYSPTIGHYSPTKAHYSPTKAHYSPTKAHYSPSKSHYSPTKAHYSPTKAHYSPTKDHLQITKPLSADTCFSPSITQHPTIETNESIHLDEIVDALCDLAMESLECNHAAVALMNPNRNLWKTKGGKLEPWSNIFYCDYVLRTKKGMTIGDIETDSLFLNEFPKDRNPLEIRFYAGTPLLDSNGACFGAVCVMDRAPKTIVDENKLKVMGNLAQLASLSIKHRSEIHKRTPPNQEMDDSQLLPQVRMLQMIQKARQTQIQVDANQDALRL